MLPKNRESMMGIELAVAGQMLHKELELLHQFLLGQRCEFSTLRLFK